MASAHSDRQGRHRDRSSRWPVANVFDGNVLGLSTLAVMVAMSDTNGGMFLALTSVMGNKEDSGTYVVQSIETGPFLTMLIFVGTGLAVIPWLTMVSVIAPIVVGAMLGNLDDDIKSFLRVARADHRSVHGVHAGTNDQPEVGGDGGMPGVVLGLTVLVVTGFVCIVADRLLGGTGIAGAAASSTAGNSAAVPQAVALADPVVRAGRRSRDRPGGRVGDRHRDPDAAPDLVVVQASDQRESRSLASKGNRAGCSLP